MSASKRLPFDQMEFDDMENAANDGYRGPKAIVLEVPITTKQFEHLRRLGWKFGMREVLENGCYRYSFKR
jgi:hypothetical protein